MDDSQGKRIQRDYTLGLKLAVVDLVEKGEMTLQAIENSAIEASIANFIWGCLIVMLKNFRYSVAPSRRTICTVFNDSPCSENFLARL